MTAPKVAATGQPELAGYMFDLKYKHNIEAAALSRLPLAEPEHTKVMDCAEVSPCLSKKHTGWIGSITSNINVIPEQVQIELKGFSTQEVRDAQLAESVVGAISGFVE